MIFKDDKRKELPQKVQKRVNEFIDWLKNVSRLKPNKDLKKEEVEKQIKFILKCFWVEAEIEYRKLQREDTWDSARDSAWASARDSAWASAWDSARDSVWASAEILIENNKDFKKKYPNGAFQQLFKLWEMGLYPVGILKENKKFVIYVPPCKMEFPFNTQKELWK